MANRSRKSDIDQLGDAVIGLQKSLECTICLELMTESVKTRCGHSFCRSCIGKVLQMKGASCPLCKENLNRRNISKDDDMQTYIEKYKSLVAAIQADTNIDHILLLAHSKKPRDTRESCSYPDSRQSGQDRNKEKRFEKERFSRQLNKNAKRQTDKPSTSCGTMIDRGDPRYDSNVSNKKPEIIPSFYHAHTFDDDGTHITSNAKIHTWLHQVPVKMSTDDLITENEIPPIKDKARPANPISDDGKSDEIIEIYSDGIDASQDRKRNTDSPERIDGNNTSQVNKGASQSDEVIDITSLDSASRGLKYNSIHARMRAKEYRKEKSNIETVNQDSSSSMTTCDKVHPIAASVSSSTSNTSAITEQSTANWSRMIEFGKEMKRTKKRKVKKLNVSTEKNRNPPRIVEDIILSPNSRYDSINLAESHKSVKETNVSNRLESNDQKQDATDKSLNLSDAKVIASNETNVQIESNKPDSAKSTYSTMNTSYVTLEEGRQIRIMNLNNDQVNKIVGFEDVAEDPHNRDREENIADYDLSLSQRKRLTVLTPEILHESAHERKIIRNVSQTPTNDFKSSFCLPTEKRTPESRETSYVQGTSNGAAFSYLQSPTPSKGRLSLKRRGIDDNKRVDSPVLSEIPLSYRLSIGKHEEYIGDRKSVDSPIPKVDELSDRLKVVRRELNFQIHEAQQRTGQDTVPVSISKNIINIEDNGGNVFKIVRQDKKLSHNIADESMISTESIGVENQGRRSLIKFTQLGSLIRHRNDIIVRYLCLGTMKYEQSMRAEVRVTPVCNVLQSDSKFEDVAISNLWNNSHNLNNIATTENISLAKNSNANEAVSKELLTSSICTTSTPKRNIGSHLNQKKDTMITCPSTNADQRSDKSTEIVAEKNAQSFHRTSHSDKSAICETISHIHPGTSKSIKLLSPDKDSQLKFLAIDSPSASEREALRRASSIKSVIKGNNFSEMKSSHLAASTLGKAQEPFIENSYTKRKRTQCAKDTMIFEDESSDGNDDSSDVASNSSQITVKLDRYSRLSEKVSSSRLDEIKKRRLNSSDDQDVEVILSISKKQEAPERKFKTSSLDAKLESTTHITKNLDRHSDDQSAQRNVSITDLATKKCPTKQNSEDLRVRNIIDKWTNEHNMMQKKLTKEDKNSQNDIKSMRSPPEENSASHQSSRSSNVLKMEQHKNSKPSQKSSARESDMFESSSFFNTEIVDCILQQPTRDANDSSKKITNSFNDDIINKVLQIDRSRSNTDACEPPDSVPQNGITNRRSKDSREHLLQDNFDEIIANVEQPQSEDFIPCTEQPDRNPNHPLAKQKTSNCLAMTDESCGVMQETPIVPPSSTNDMFEYYSPRNTRKLRTPNISTFLDSHNERTLNSDKENVAYNQKRRSHVNDQGNKKDTTSNADTTDKDSRKTIGLQSNILREKEKFIEERDISIHSTGRLYVGDDETHNVIVVGNKSISKDDTFDDSLMNITQHQARLQMFEEDLFSVAPRNQTKETKVISQNDPFQREQRTPRKRKQNCQDKNTESEERFADEDDVVENTPEKKMKNGNNVSTIESRECTKIAFLTPLLKTAERTPDTSERCRTIEPFLRSGASTPTDMFGRYPQSTPMSQASKRIERVKSSDISLAKTLENVRQQHNKRDLRFVCSGLSADQIATVKEFAAKYNADYVGQFDHAVTHVIVKTIGEHNAAKSTLKYLQGIAHRKWIVSYRWIENCNRQQKLLDEAPYEATTQNDAVTIGAGPRNSRLRDKGLFEGFTFLCVGPYDNVSLDQYQDLLRATGAKVTDSFEVLAKMGGIKGVVIQDNVHEDKIIERWYQIAKVAPILVDWIVECISHYKLFKLASYIPYLSPQEFCAIGYPRELVEEDETYNDNE